MISEGSDKRSSLGLPWPEMFAPLREQYALRTSAKQYAEHAAMRSEHALDIGAKVYQVIDRQQFKNILLKADAHCSAQC